ncbi:mRNA-decapping enzyme 2 [Paragonimus heterotremus]|uniref:mRNA-decapping enzyme 2 n=1 Tax=Paragonimus heterotremus TaxID=100268 RepID=A0A8J4T6J5_9TREM|nr:mRNA-decapping enzyme 2 [Paragonimus heterotremus]
MISERPAPVLPRNTLIQLYTRFLLNLPNELKEECKRNFVRLLFEVERAHWFYLDHYIEDPSVGGVDMYGFTEQLFRQFPEIVPKGVNWREKFAEWRRYRGETETGSAIILDEYFEMVLLVQGFYGNRWNFPGGKVNENETLIDCAAREVLEETGLDVEYRIVPSLYIDRFIGGALRRAFIIENMPRMSRLQPCTRNEIEAITWFNVHDLPTHAQDNRPMEKFNMRANNFFLLLPFVKQLQEYVKLRLTGLLPLSALEESGRLVDLDRPIVSTMDGPRSTIENVTSPKQFRSRGKKNYKARQATRSSVSAAVSVSSKVADTKCIKPNIPFTSAVPVNIDLNEFRVSAVQ